MRTSKRQPINIYAPAAFHIVNRKLQEALISELCTYVHRYQSITQSFLAGVEGLMACVWVSSCWMFSWFSWRLGRTVPLLSCWSGWVMAWGATGSFVRGNALLTLHHSICRTSIFCPKGAGKNLIPRVVGLFVSRNKDTSPGVPGIPRCARCSFCIYGDIQTVFSMPWWFASRSDLASIALKKYFAVYRDSVTCLNCALACNAFFRRFLTLTARQGQLYNPTHLLIEHDVVDAANGTSWSCESPTLSCLEAPPFFGPTHPNWIESLPAGQVLQLTMYLSTAASGDASLSSLVASRCRLSLPLLRFPLSSLPSFAQDPLPLSPLLAPRSSLSRSYCTVTAPAPPLQEIIVPSFNERPSSLMLAFLGCRSQACMPLW